MLNLSELLADLKYDKSSYYRNTESQFEPETVHLFRAARKIKGVDGIYVFQTSPGSKSKILSARPAVYVAEAKNEDEARQIHKSLWNLAYAPFLIVLLPHQLRIYTGFNYSAESAKEGLLREANHLEELQDLLLDFSADSIDTGHIWQLKRYIDHLDPKQRVDIRLLKNLEELGKILIKSDLPPEVAHALIGKYVYIRYLWDRKILTDKWLEDENIKKESIFSREATITGLSELTKALEGRFNGEIFPIDFKSQDSLSNKQVAWTASVFMGDKIEATEPNFVRQLHLAFQAYDFQYIPIETLSAIYEQFIDKRKEKGAVYTPEILADYLLSEVNWAKRLERGMKILDPSCGSGIFLVLAYRRLIEMEMARLGRKLEPEELNRILLESIYGVERELDACYVAEFSLILTLLNYLDPPQLHENPEFKFPYLHNNHVFESDFFDNKSRFWQLGLEFDWIVGNPPWIELKPNTAGEKLVRTWIVKNQIERPVAGNRVADAFSWRVTDLLSSDGIAGLILPATSLFNLESQAYRQQFFKEHEVIRITNFANLREVLFDKRGTLPAATIIYRQAVAEREKSYITHYGPFSVNQILDMKSRPWAITINENEIQTVSPYEAERGETSTWKFALWGTQRDKWAIERLCHLFPTTLETFCKKKGWGKKLPCEGAQLRDGSKIKLGLEYLPDLREKKRFNTDIFNKLEYRFSIPPSALEPIPDSQCFVRIRGGKTGLNITQAPHIILSAAWGNFVIYSDEDFVIPPRQMGIAGPEEDKEYLQALAVYLSSSLVAYYLFFHTQEWGIFRQAKRVSVNEVRKIPTPSFTVEQIRELATLQRELAEREKGETVASVFPSDFHIGLQKILDEKIFSTLEIPEDIAVLVREFVQIRLQLDGGQAAIQKVTRPPNKSELLAYAHELRDELDDFVMGTAYHKITLTWSKELIECVVEITSRESPISIDEENIKEGDLTTTKLLAEIRDTIGQRFSQWVYVQRGLRLFDGPRIYIYKSPRLIDWTRTQALNDANDIIGQVLSTRISSNEKSRA